MDRVLAGCKYSYSYTKDQLKAKLNEIIDKQSDKIMKMEDLFKELP